MGKGMRDFEKGQTVYYSPAVSVGSLSWVVGAVDVIGSPDSPGCGFIQKENRLFEVKDLPAEFFNHQLMDCDCSDFEALRSFVTAWGLPYSPYRYIDGKEGYRALGRGDSRKEAEAAFKFTDGLIKAPYPAAISLFEVKHSISRLQWVVTELRKAVSGEEFDGEFLETINAATCSDLRAGIVQDSKVHVHGRGWCWNAERLTCAICNQIVEAMALGRPWRLCACEGCGVIFKSRADTKDSRGNSRYCSKACQKRQEKRNGRYRIDHGL